MESDTRPIGEITNATTEAELRAGAILVPTPEFVSPYVGLSNEQKAQIMSEVEIPLLPRAIKESKD